MDDFNIGVDWSTPVTEAEPCGRNTEYDTSFAELEAAATPTVEQQYGDTLIAGKEPDWPLVLRLAGSLSQQTRDLRVQLLMTRALTKLHGLPGLLYGLRSVHAVSREHWDGLHPQLIHEGEADPQLRFSALSNFADVQGLGADLRHSTVLTSHLGALTIKDLERLLETGSVEIKGSIVTDAQLSQMIDNQRNSEHAQMLEIPGLVAEEIQAIARIYQERMGTEYLPDFAVLLRPLQKIVKLIKNYSDKESTDNVPYTTTNDPATGEAFSPGLLIQGVGHLHSRREAIRQLDLVCRYFEINEPTNPAPFLIRRAIKVMEMNFMDILRDMAPEGLNQASFITGVDMPGDT